MMQNPETRVEPNNEFEAHIREKWALYTNLTEHFNKIEQLPKILFEYNAKMSDEKTDKKKLKTSTKKKLIRAGVYNDQRILEFLLLISERKRHTNQNINSQELNDEQLCHHYFEQYRSESEQWSDQNFKFRLTHNSSWQSERDSFLEEIAITMIIESRGRIAESIKKPPTEVTSFLSSTDQYFQQAFLHFFGVKAPVSILTATLITKEPLEEADKISQHTFVGIGYFYESKEKFFQYLIHEIMHLCFAEIGSVIAEEAVIEYFREKMMRQTPHDVFLYKPTSEIYSEYKKIVEKLLKNKKNEKDLITYLFNQSAARQSTQKTTHEKIARALKPYQIS